jgi:hypothetical protein
MIYKTLHRKLRIEQREPTKNGGELCDKSWTRKEPHVDYDKIFRTFICSTFIWSTHLSAGPIFQRFWFLSWFHWKRVAVNKKATVPSVPSDYYFERFKVATMNWLIVTDYMCPKRPRICSVYRNHNAVLSAFMTCHRVHFRFWWVSVARSLVFCVVFCISLFVLLRCL